MGKLVRYEENHLGIINAMDRQPAFESGGAGLVSTIDDYARFAQMLLNEGELDGRRILQPATVRFMTAGQLDQVQRAAFVRNFSNMPGFSYGNLMRVMKDPGQSVTLNHVGEYGWDGWLGCYFANDPAAGDDNAFYDAENGFRPHIGSPQNEKSLYKRDRRITDSL